MLFLKSTAAAPAFFSSPEVFELESELGKHFGLSDSERSRRRAPHGDFIFKNEEVSAAVVRLSHGKCAYCEKRLESSFGWVSGYRPSSNATNARGETSSVDHYSWLYHRWENLLSVCGLCNLAKLNFFPVIGPRARPKGTWREAEAEERALLINPRYTDPSKHITFDINGAAFDLTLEGQTTIAVLELNRQSLVEERSAALRSAWTEYLEMENGEGELQRRLLPSQPWSGVLRCFIIQVIEFAYRTYSVPRILGGEIARLSDLRSRLTEQQFESLHTRFKPRKTAPKTTQPRKWFTESVQRHPQLKEISLLNFKGIESLTITLPRAPNESSVPSLMLLGENSTGKSSVLQAIALACMPKAVRTALPLIAEQFVPREVGTWRIDWNKPPQVKIRFFDEQETVFGFDIATGSFVKVSGPDCLVLGYGSRRFFVSNKGQRARVNPSLTLFDPIATLPDPKEWLNSLDDEKFDAVARALRSVLALRSEDKIMLIDGAVMVEAHGRISPIDRMSDGYRSLFAMVCDILRHLLTYFDNFEFARALVLIDEIETHLHPRWKKKVMSSLRGSLPNVQFIVTTHDPLCLRGMRQGEVQVMYREPNGRVVLLENLPDVSLLRTEQLLTSRYFGLSSTADEEQEQILAELAKLSGRSDDSLTVQDRKRRDSLLSQYGGIPYMGDSPDRQILARALTEHLRTPPVSFARSSDQSDETIDALVGLFDRALKP